MTGTYRLIHIKGKLIWLLAALGNRKVFEGDKGHNVCLGVRWGEFEVFFGDLLFYKWWPIVDYLAPDGDNLKGTFFWGGKKKGEFRLTKLAGIG